MAREIDVLIPGKPVWNASPIILCFISPESWLDQPMVLFGRRHVGEPPSVRPNTTRIALRSNVLPGAYQRFAFQLAHELAHIKMDPRLDNELIETFAVAVSLEVLKRMGYRDFVGTNEHFYAQALPNEVQQALTSHQFDILRTYLRYRWRPGAPRPADYSLQLIGATIIRADKTFRWRNLLGIGTKGKCGVTPVQDETKFCPLNTSALPEFKTMFEKLGVTTDTKLIRRALIQKPQDGAFAFQENGKWVSLGEVKNSDALPAGYIQVD